MEKNNLRKNVHADQKKKGSRKRSSEPFEYAKSGLIEKKDTKRIKHQRTERSTSNNRGGDKTESISTNYIKKRSGMYSVSETYNPYVLRGASPTVHSSRPISKYLKSDENIKKVRNTNAASEDESKENDELLLIGKNSVWEALKAGRSIEHIYIAENIEPSTVAGIVGVANREHIKLERISKSRLNEIAGCEKHQGVAAYLSAATYMPFDELLEKAFTTSDKPVFILLDEVQDPHNLGAVIRSADCAGVSGIIILEHRAVGLTSTVAKVSAGALMHVPVSKVKNLSKAISVLQEKGTMVFGAVMDGIPCFECDFASGPIAFVIGNEGIGIRRLVKEQCDVLTQIPIYGHVDSLNASVAAAVLMFEALRQKRQCNGPDLNR